MENMFIRVGEKEFGPVSLRELEELVKEGSFDRQDYVWSDDLGEWILAEHVVELRDVFDVPQPRTDYGKTIWAVASGKGGVGKTVLSSSIGVGLASMGQEVIMVDGDLGGANLHTCMGILDPEFTFFDFYTLQKESLADIVLQTPVENLSLISGACGTLGLANPKYFQKQRFIRELKKLEADSIILDLGAGAGFNTIDFFMLADERILVTTPEPTSVYEAFGFIKVCLLRELNRKLKNYPDARAIVADAEINKPNHIKQTVGDVMQCVGRVSQEALTIFKDTLQSFTPKLILNMVKSDDELKEAQAIQAAALELLCVRVEMLGYISFDFTVKDAVKKMKPFLLFDAKGRASQDLSAMIRVNILGKKGVKELLERRRWRRQMQNYGQEYPERNVEEEAPICSVRCFYWGDCEYENGGSPCPVRHMEPVLQAKLVPA